MYERLEAVAGVVGVRIRRFEREETQAAENVVTAAVDEWLRLSPNHLTLTTVAAPVAR